MQELVGVGYRTAQPVVGQQDGAHGRRSKPPRHTLDFGDVPGPRQLHSAIELLVGRKVILCERIEDVESIEVGPRYARRVADRERDVRNPNLRGQ